MNSLQLNKHDWKWLGMFYKKKNKSGVLNIHKSQVFDAK